MNGPPRGAPLLLGWREWAGLPDLGVRRIKCKVDTGARTSALHAYYLERFEREGRPFVRFGLHPLQRRTDVARTCESEVVDERLVSDSGGHRERRLVIHTTVALGDHAWPVELTLTDRDTMLFRMLLGRTALAANGCIVDPGRSYVLGRRRRRRTVPG